MPRVATSCLFEGNRGGNEVEVEGSFDNWSSRTRLQKTGNSFTIVKLLPPGVYQYKFIVDNEWQYDPSQPAMYDDSNNVNNVIEVQEFVPENLDSLAGFDQPPSPEASYDRAEPSPDDFQKEPPIMPPHLNLALLNVPPALEAQAVLPRPLHVVLNHTYLQKDADVCSVLLCASVAVNPSLCLQLEHHVKLTGMMDNVACMCRAPQEQRWR